MPTAKLTPAFVVALRAAYRQGAPYGELHTLCRWTGIGREGMREAISGRTWGWVEDARRDALLDRLSETARAADERAHRGGAAGWPAEVLRLIDECHAAGVRQVDMARAAGVTKARMWQLVHRRELGR